MLEFLQKNINTIKYGFIIVNIFFMIVAIKAIVNYQNIITSIETVQSDIRDKNNHTDYINNFVTPYLQSEYAPYFFAHENNQIFPGEILIKITEVASGSVSTTTGSVVSTGSQARNNPSAQQSRTKYLQEITKEVKFKN